jgi:hypothetical protein
MRLLSIRNYFMSFIMQKILATLGSPLWRIVRNLTHPKQTCVGPLSRCSVLVALLFAATNIPAQIIMTNAYIAYDSTANYSWIGGAPTITANGGIWNDRRARSPESYTAGLGADGPRLVRGVCRLPGTILSSPKLHEFGWFVEQLGTVVGPASGWSQFIDATVPDRQNFYRTVTPMKLTWHTY